MATMPKRAGSATVVVSGKRRRKKSLEKKLSRTKKPDELSLEQWQAALRRQFGQEQSFELRNVGNHPIFSEFQLFNPASGKTYRIAIRGTQTGDNYCSCPDFATNNLGTCKHVEFALARLARRKGGKKALAGGYQPAYSEVYLHYGAQREIRFRPGRDCPVELARLAAKFFDADGTLRPDGYASFETFLSKAAGLENELRCRDESLAFIAEVRDAQSRQTVLAERFAGGTRSAAFKKLLKVTLYDYQRQGALFAAQAGRCLIGDEMGLGKTIQAIAAAEIMAQLFGVQRALIVCPTSLKHQWEREISKFTERTAEVVNGLRPRRQELFNTNSFFKIINYDTVHRDLDLIGDWAPDLVILDEAQRIKNWETRTAKTVKQIKSPHAIVLTGTPLENRLEELVSIVQFIDIHRLGPTYRLLHDHQIKDENGRVVGYRALDKIGKTLEPVLIRRRKAEVLDQLPGRIEKLFFVPMTPQQQDYHDENKATVSRIVQKWQRFGFLTEADQRRLMIALQNMRMACDSTYLLDQTTDFGNKSDELATLLDEIFETSNSKVVIFSQWKRMHEMLIRRFAQRDWQYAFFHGGVESSKRKDLIDRFRDDPACRLFLSTDAGGVGLNLQHANVVINMDLPWNPAVLEQRIGRVHRLGQTQPVQVFNFVAQHTIEESMLEVIRFKKSVFAGVLDGGEKEVFLGGSRLKKFMQTVEQVSSNIPAATNDESAAEAADVDRASPLVRAPGSNGSTDGAARRQPASDLPALAADACADEPAVMDSTDEPPLVESRRAQATGSAPIDGLMSDPIGELLRTGLGLLQQFVAAAGGGGALPASTGGTTPSGPDPAIAGRTAVQTVRDSQTGETYLKVALPKPDVLRQAAAALRQLLESFGGR